MRWLRRCAVRFVWFFLEHHGQDAHESHLKRFPVALAPIFSQEARKLAREKLQLMHFLNLLKLAEMFARQPEKLNLYMQQSLLEETTAPDEEESPPAPPTPPGA